MDWKFLLTMSYLKIEDKDGKKIAHCNKEQFISERIVVCVGGGTEKFTKLKIKRSLAPIAVVKNVPDNTNSFVELDYFKKMYKYYYKKFLLRYDWWNKSF